MGCRFDRDLSPWRISGPALQQNAAVTFSNIAVQAGINFKHENGATPQKYMPETMGAGALIFDYDSDGWPDIFLVNGGSFADHKVAAAARHRLYRNNGNGKFTDTTADFRHFSIGLRNGRLLRRLR